MTHINCLMSMVEFSMEFHSQTCAPMVALVVTNEDVRHFWPEGGFV